MSRYTCLVLLIALLGLAIGILDDGIVIDRPVAATEAQVRAKDEQIAGSEEQVAPTDEEIAALVEQLVSPNSAPVVKSVYAEYPPGYDKVAQKKVHHAFHELRKLSPRSFPFLFDHMDDKRYCLTADAGDFDRNYTVGELCRDILSSHLQSDVWDHKSGGTSFRRRPDQPDYLAHHKLFEPKAAKEWWKTRKDKSLRELQIEVLEWVVEEEVKAPDKYPEAERAKIRETVKKLKASEKPLEPGFPFSR